MRSDPVGDLSGPRWRSTRGRRHSAWIAAGLALAACLLPAPATGATYTWWATGSSGTAGGTGTWNTANAYWTTNGSAWVPWDNTTNAGDTAEFGGTAGTVSLGTPITANGLSFATTGYTVTGQTITLASGTPTITVSSGTAMVSSILAGTAGLRKMGSGTLTLSAANTYSGTTTINNGMLQIGAGGTSGSLGTGPIRLSGSGNIAFNRSDNLTVTNTISLTSYGIGGFVTHSGAGTLDLSQVTVNGITTTAGAGDLTVSGTLQLWKRTYLGQNYAPVFRPAAGTTIAVTGAFAPDSTWREIQVENLASSGTAGTVFLGGATKFLGGVFTKRILAGALDIVGGTDPQLLAGSVWFMDISGAGGVLQLSGTLTSPLGSGTGQIAWLGGVYASGGFAARTAPAVINIGGSGQQMTSGTTNFIQAGHLIFGSNTADNVVTFENPIDMAGNLFRVRVVDNPNSSADSAVLSGVLSNGGLEKSGDGLLTLTGNNTYAGTLIKSGTLRIGAGGTTGSIIGGVDNRATLAFNRSNALTFSGSISGTGNFLKQGAGNLVLDGTSTYTGATTIEAGRLSVNGVLGSSPVSVLSAAELGGSGAIGGPVSVSSGGTLSPGNSIASLATGTATFAAGALFEYEVDSTNLAALATAADLLVVNGSLNLDPGNGTILSFIDLAASPNAFVNDATLFALVNYSGTWNGGLFTHDGTVLADGDRFFVGSQEWEIDYDRSSSAGLDNFTADYLPSSKFVTVMAVPEPSTIVMALAGLACGGFSMRRRRTRS
jgi:fibronectin-binding autotransporter adhesin